MEDLQKLDEKLPYDVVEDIAIFMRNDPKFYRKTLFPVLDRMKTCYHTKKQFDAKKELFPVIDKAIGSYCKKFKLHKRPDDLLDQNEKMSLFRKLYSEEMTQIRKGTYDK